MITMADMLSLGYFELRRPLPPPPAGTRGAPLLALGEIEGLAAFLAAELDRHGFHDRDIRNSYDAARILNSAQQDMVSACQQIGDAIRETEREDAA